MPRLALILLGLIVGVPSAALGQHRRHVTRSLPTFDQYAVNAAHATTGKMIVITKMQFGSESDSQFQNRIRAAAKAGPNFAGHYAIVGWSCGMICYQLAVVDVNSGKRLRGLPFEGIADEPCPRNYTDDGLVSFRLNSRLLILRGSTEEWGPDGVQDQPCSTRYYVWQHNRLVLLRKIIAPEN
jgi:hypothetical protein